MEDPKFHMHEAQRKVMESNERMVVTLVGQGIRPSIYANLWAWLRKPIPLDTPEEPE